MAAASERGRAAAPPRLRPRPLRRRRPGKVVPPPRRRVAARTPAPSPGRAAPLPRPPPLPLRPAAAAAPRGESPRRAEGYGRRGVLRLVTWGARCARRGPSPSRGRKWPGRARGRSSLPPEASPSPPPSPGAAGGSGSCPAPAAAASSSSSVPAVQSFRKWPGLSKALRPSGSPSSVGETRRGSQLAAPGCFVPCGVGLVWWFWWFVLLLRVQAGEILA